MRCIPGGSSFSGEYGSFLVWLLKSEAGVWFGAPVTSPRFALIFSLLIDLLAPFGHVSSIYSLMSALFMFLCACAPLSSLLDDENLTVMSFGTYQWTVTEAYCFHTLSLCLSNADH